MIQEYENSLRSVISIILGESDSIDFKVTAERVEIWKAKREEEKKKYDGVLKENRIIYYSDFYDLGTIVLKHWEKFKDVFNDKKRFEALFNEVENYRNTVLHGRELLPYEEELLKGIVGDLKTKIVIFHNKNKNIDDFFIKLLKISDSTGYIWNNSMGNIVATNSILRVGDVIELLVDAYDPKGREITYTINISAKGINAIAAGLLEKKNKEGKFRIDVTKQMISKSMFIEIMVSTEQSEYVNKESVHLAYSVLPSQLIQNNTENLVGS